jgi:hypothetical protein
MTKRLLLFVLIVMLALQVGFLAFTPAEAVGVIKRYGYVWMLVIHVWFCWCLWGSFKDGEGTVRGFAALCRNWRTGLFLLMAAGVFHIHERHEFKIVADELVIGNVGMQMHFERSSAMAVRAYDYASNYTVLAEMVDKRPLAFPFLLATVHDLTGYRVTNVFWVNGLVSLGLVTMVWLVSMRVGGAKAGVAAVLLLCGVPLVGQNATGAGFELHNLFMILLTMWLGMRYSERPDRARLGAFVLSGIILAQVRYESALFVLPVGATVLWVWWRNRKMDISPVILAAPLLMLPVPLQQNVFTLTEATWQLNDVQGATSPFGLGYFYPNVGHALNFFLSFDGSQPSSWLLAFIGVPAVGFALLRLYREHRAMAAETPQDIAVSIFILGLILHSGFMLCYFWGAWDEPIIRRLSLPTHALLLVSVAFVWGRLIKHRHAWEWLIAGAALHVVFFAIPASARHPFTQENFAAATCNWVSDHIARSVPGTALAIDDNAGHVWLLHRKSCISPDRLSVNWEGFVHHLEHKSFSGYFVVQRVAVDQKTGEKYVSAKDDFGGGLKLELIEERAFAPFYFMRLSRVIGADRDKLRTWAAERMRIRERARKAGLTEREMWVSEPTSGDLLEQWFKALP